MATKNSDEPGNVPRAHVRLTAVAAGAAAPPSTAPGMTSARFGREHLYVSDTEPAQRTASRGARVPSREKTVSKEELHIVVQNGREFQREHPSVPVLHDAGRYLLVQLDPAAAKNVDRSETCYRIRPLRDGEVVFDERVPVAARAAVPFVNHLVESATAASIQTSVSELAAFPTRHSTSPQFASVSALVRQKLRDLGYTTRLQAITVRGLPSCNVIADKPGFGPAPREVVAATAHLDSVNLGDGPSASAPGADDNGSGSAGVLEIARAFAAHRGLHDLRLILFGGEEQGLFGSKQYVASLSGPQRKRIRAVVNMDMIANLNTPAQSVLLEGRADSQRVIDGLADAAAMYTGLIVQTSLNAANSDHVPFLDAQMPAVLTIEGADHTNASIHSAADTADKLEFRLALEIVRMNIGFIANELGLAP